MLLMSVCSFAQNGNTPLKGDVNGDGKVDVADIVAILKIMKDAGGQGESKENTVTFIDRGTVLKTITGQEGTPVTAPSNPTRSGYEFKGWNENESAGVGGQVITKIGTRDVTYYAQWEEVQEQTTYYWYVGHTNPTTMSSVTPLNSNDASAGAGWRTIGTTLPTYSKTSPLWDGTIISTASSKSTQYVALPSDQIKSHEGINGGDVTLDAWTISPTKKILNGVQYTIWTSINTKKSFADILY